MKNLIMIFCIAIFAFSCSDETLNESPNLDQSKEVNDMSNTINDIVQNEEFLSVIANQSSLRNSENGNGVFVIENNFSIIFGIQTDDNKVLFLGPDPGDDYIAFLPNGNTRFFANSSNPTAFVLDLNTFTLAYSNNCYEDKSGRFNASVTGTFTESELPFGTVYFIDEVQSAEVMNGHTNVNDAMMQFDEEGLPMGCSEATVEKRLRVHMVFRDNNGQGLEPVVNYSLR